MASKKLNPREYAEQFYGLARCTGHAATYQDTVIIDCRVRAFIDGVRWQQNQQKAAAARKKRRVKRS